MELLDLLSPSDRSVGRAENQSLKTGNNEKEPRKKTHWNISETLSRQEPGSFAIIRGPAVIYYSIVHRAVVINKELITRRKPEPRNNPKFTAVDQGLNNRYSDFQPIARRKKRLPRSSTNNQFSRSSDPTRIASLKRVSTRLNSFIIGSDWLTAKKPRSKQEHCFRLFFFFFLLLLWKFRWRTIFF